MATWRWKVKYKSNCKQCNIEFDHAKQTAIFCSFECKNRNCYERFKLKKIENKIRESLKDDTPKRSKT